MKNGDVRLSGGSSYQGVLQVYYNGRYTTNNENPGNSMTLIYNIFYKPFYEMFVLERIIIMRCYLVNYYNNQKNVSVLG